MTITRLARPEIQSLRPYEAAAQIEDTIRLNANEAPFTNSADRFRRPLNRYPEVRPQKLAAELANRYGCERRQLLVTRGSSEAIDLLIRAFCRPAIDNIVTSKPTFSMYRHYAVIQGVDCREVTTFPEANFALSTRALLNACDDSTRLIFLCSPNNPTGALLPVAQLTEILERRTDRSAVVVDEAYVEFANADSAISLLEKYENLIVLRTLSKALAFAGARCGSVIARSDVIAMLDAVQAPYALATPVVECVEDALETESLRESDDWVGQIVAERDRLTAAIAEFPFVRRVWHSAANFFLIEVADATEVLLQSKAQNILLRHYGGEHSDYLRISVGTPVENDRLLELFSNLQAAQDVE